MYMRIGRVINVDLSQYKTSDIVNELKTREGIKAIIAEPYEDKPVTVNGPAIILVVTD